MVGIQMTGDAVKDFYSVSELLDYAYRMEASHSAPALMTELQSRGTNPATLTPLEKMADGIMIKNTAMRCLNTDIAIQAIAVYYRQPYDDQMYQMHEDNISHLSHLVMEERPMIPNKYFVADVIREWSCHAKPHQTLDWWAKHMGKPLGTVKTWAISGDDARKSIKSLCEAARKHAEYSLEETFKDLLV